VWNLAADSRSRDSSQWVWNKLSEWSRKASTSTPLFTGTKGKTRSCVAPLHLLACLLLAQPTIRGASTASTLAAAAQAETLLGVNNAAGVAMSDVAPAGRQPLLIAHFDLTQPVLFRGQPRADLELLQERRLQTGSGHLMWGCTPHAGGAAAADASAPASPATGSDVNDVQHTVIAVSSSSDSPSLAVVDTVAEVMEDPDGDVACQMCLKKDFTAANPIIMCDVTDCMRGQHVLCWSGPPPPIDPVSMDLLEFRCYDHAFSTDRCNIRGIGRGRRSAAERAVRNRPRHNLPQRFVDMAALKLAKRAIKEYRKAAALAAAAGCPALASASTTSASRVDFAQVYLSPLHAQAGLAFNCKALDVELRASTLPGAGRGAFVVRPGGHEAGDVVGWMYGKFVNADELNRLRRRSFDVCPTHNVFEAEAGHMPRQEESYLDEIEAGNWCYLDPMLCDELDDYTMLVSAQCPMRYVNDPRDAKRVNVRLAYAEQTLRADREMPWRMLPVVATRAIGEGREMFISYGWSDKQWSEQAEVARKYAKRCVAAAKAELAQRREADEAQVQTMLTLDTQASRAEAEQRGGSTVHSGRKRHPSSLTLSTIAAASSQSKRVKAESASVNTVPAPRLVGIETNPGPTQQQAASSSTHGAAVSAVLPHAALHTNGGAGVTRVKHARDSNASDIDRAGMSTKKARCVDSPVAADSRRSSSASISPIFDHPASSQQEELDDLDASEDDNIVDVDTQRFVPSHMHAHTLTHAHTPTGSCPLLSCCGICALHC
jgi:hypothetical protein